MEETKPKKKENVFVRFLVSLIWLVLSVAVDVVAVISTRYVVGVVIELLFFIITFSVPYLRRKGTYTRWFGWLALLQAGWLVYLMISA